MTRINIGTDIPPSAQGSLEALVTWGLTVLAGMYPDVIAVEGLNPDNSPIWVRSITVSPLLNTALSVPPDVIIPNPGVVVTAKTPSEKRLVCRYSIYLNPDFQGANGTYWNSVTTLGDNLPIPNIFKPPIAT